MGRWCVLAIRVAMFLRPVGRRAATALVGGFVGCTALSHRQSRAEGVGTDQWLWNFDGIMLRRDANGQVIYVDQATGEKLPSRPESVPNEAYANRTRSPPHPGWDAEARRKVANRHVLLIRHSQYNLDGKSDLQRTLTDVGYVQAEHLAKRLAEIHATSDGCCALRAPSKLHALR